MSSATVRISLPARDKLRDLADQVGQSMQSVAEDAIELYRRRRFLEDVNAAYGELRHDAEAWSEIEEERKAWDGTLADGRLQRHRLVGLLEELEDEVGSIALDILEEVRRAWPAAMCSVEE